MSMTGQHRGTPEARRLRFGNTHLGAQKCSGNAGSLDFPYIAYHESGAANYLELTSILAVIAGMGLMFVLLNSEKNSFGDYCLFALGIFAVNRAFALLARTINNAQVRSRIARDEQYAREFAVKYPEQAYICRELNEMYAVNPDAVPEDELRAAIEEKEIAESTKVRIIGYILFAFFLLLSAAFIGFLIWAFRETT